MPFIRRECSGAPEGLSRACDCLCLPRIRRSRRKLAPKFCRLECNESDLGSASGVLRRRRARHRDRRARAQEIRAAGLRPARDRAQQARRRKPEGEGRACSSRTCRRSPTTPSRSSAPTASPRAWRTRPPRSLPVLDATCPLVTKVHNQGKRYVGQGRKLILIGHAGHPEVEGTMGQIPSPVILVQNEADVEKLDLPVDTPVAYVTQTTLSVDDTQGIIAGAAAQVHRYRRPRDTRHLLRDAKSSVGGARPEQACRRHSCGRCDQQLELKSPARDRRGVRAAELPDCRRQRAQSEMARGREGRRSHGRRFRAGGIG